MTGEIDELEEIGAFRDEVRAWCREHVPSDWRQAQTGITEAEWISLQREWFATLRSAGYAVPHWPAEWGGGLSTAQQVVLYQELAAADSPRTVLQFVSIHHAAATLLEAGSREQQERHLPAILDGAIWVQGFSEPEAGSDLASLRTVARREGDHYVVNGQKVWASGAAHADWCLLLARTDTAAPKRHGISYFLLDMATAGIGIRPIKQASGTSHFCEMFLTDVVIPASDLVGPENAGWAVAQATLSAERGMTMLELSERLDRVGFRWLVETCSVASSSGRRPVDDARVGDQLARFETELTGLRGLCRSVIERHETGRSEPADASIVKVLYSELLQRMTDFGTEVAGLPVHQIVEKPASSGYESRAWMLDFLTSWEWTIPGGTNEIQRTIIGERGLGLPREPLAVVPARTGQDR